MMNPEVCLVVGESHARFAECTGAVTVSELLRRLKAEGDRSLRRVVLGQGLDSAEVAAVERGLAYLAPQVQLQSFAESAPLHLTHKLCTAHNLITSPIRTAAHSYRMTLIIDGASDRLSDHVTGLHLGGMLLVEAARQATIAAIELQYPRADETRWGLLWNGLTVSFVSYAFPLPTDVFVLLNEDVSKRRANQICTVAAIELHQLSQLIARVEVDVTLKDAVLLGRLESKRARQIVGQVTGGQQGPSSSQPEIVAELLG